MISREFRTQARDAAPELNAFTTGLRLQLMRRLDKALANADSGNEKDGGAEQKKILEKLSKALKGGAQHLLFRYEETAPLSLHYEESGFHEALISLEDNGDVIPGGELLEALENGAARDIGMYFRLWLVFAQITDFTMHSEGQRLSVNIMPRDTDSTHFRDTLTRGLEIARRESTNEIILEAVEKEFWTYDRRDFLKSLVDLGITIAIDDYGAPEGFNQAETLARFQNGKSPGNLIVKLDGVLVRNFIDNNDMTLVKKLAEIREQCPSATVVAEWVNSAEEARILTDRLVEFGMGNYIHLVQSREITDPHWLFLEKFNGDNPPEEGPSPAP